MILINEHQWTVTLKSRCLQKDAIINLNKHKHNLRVDCNAFHISDRPPPQNRKRKEKKIISIRRSIDRSYVNILLLMTPARKPSAKTNMQEKTSRHEEQHQQQKNRDINNSLKQLPIFSQRSKKSLNSSIRSECFPSKSVT